METTENNSTIIASSIVKGSRAKWWTRRGSKPKTFSYLDTASTPIRDEHHLERIKSLVIPPAWREVRVCPSPKGKIQAIGIDAAGRIQYKYNADFSAKQQKKKFQKITNFGSHLPKLRRITNEHIALEGLQKNRVLAVVIRLINDLYIRVGSEKSVTLYKTYGVTTLRNRHLSIKNDELTFNFVGKHHIRHRRIVVDDELAAIMRDLKAVGGNKLFNYVSENGAFCPITPRDVNNYLKEITAPEFSAKDFRTWGATLLAATELAEIGAAETKTQINKNILKAVKNVAERLGNTPSVCRSSYIHPTVIESYQNGTTLDEFRSRRNRKISKIESEHQADEIALMKLLQN